MAHFTHSFVDDNTAMEIVLTKGFSAEHQEELMNFYKERSTKSIMHWYLNLKQLDVINSVTLGMLVALNAAITSRNGTLFLLLNRQSKVADLLLLAKLDRIMRFVFT